MFNVKMRKAGGEMQIRYSFISAPQLKMPPAQHYDLNIEPAAYQYLQPSACLRTYSSPLRTGGVEIITAVTMPSAKM